MGGNRACAASGFLQFEQLEQLDFAVAAGESAAERLAMNPQEILRIVDAIHRDKNIDKEIVFEGIEAALVSAAKKHYGEEADIVVNIDREDGSIKQRHRDKRRAGGPQCRPLP